MASSCVTPSSSPKALCNECSGIVFDDAEGDVRDSAHWERKDSYPNLPLFRNSAVAGCSFCEYLCFVLDEKLPKPLQIALQESTTKDVVAKLSSPAYVMRSDIIDVTRDWMPDDYGIEQDGIYWLDFRFESEAWRKGPWSEGWKVRAIAYQGEDENVASALGIELKLPITNALAPSCMKRLKEWVWGCASNHPECCSPGPRSLPTRLIKVGEMSDGIARLVMSDKLPPTTSYIALSYCWGPPSVSKSQLITTAATLADRQTKIPLPEMPDTIRDAVVFARHMGIKYIWIDALCIIQDDAEDWAKEAALMFAVYRHATLTLVAAAGDTSHSGFLKRSSPGPSVLVPFESKKGQGRVSGTYVLSALNEHRTWDADYPSHMHTRAWATRAWTYQEDLMSTRVLYFDNHTSYFRCQTERRLEHSSKVYDNVQSWHHLLSPAPEDIPYNEAKERRESLYERWKDLIIEYTRRKLTVPNDKFSALSGLARTFSSALEDEYVAGLWKSDLVRGMLWNTVMQPSKPKAWRAPSWSWASSDAEIAWDLRFSLPLIQKCSIENIHIETAGSDPFGRLESAWIELCAVCVPVVLRPVQQAESDQDTYLAEVLFYEGGKIMAHGSLDAVAPSGLRNDGTFKLADFGQADEIADVSAVVLASRCVIFGLDRSSGERKFSSPSFPTGLLVKSSPEQGENVSSLPIYKRLGTFRTETEEQTEAWLTLTQSRLKLI
ncbi:HET domain-containing protein [Colletotrichum abscissum]|uniref:HET domain-containing protein n=1 Tax=Colletotrichum abscissum TaxID=1671311 RepID=A0A9Q0AWM7_9PEZI|nr:HET domain-containing protein [Colletotrichum abscissum]KAI3540283.1 HET domain-containing protein [Colletotrichum abscissum]KAK1494436.1 HET domain-containing protein [Colletotrichum abscissum]